MPKSKKGKITPQEQAQSVAYVALFIGLFLAYLWAEAFLALRPHPYHWLTALGVAAAAGGLAYGVVRWQQKRRAGR